MNIENYSDFARNLGDLKTACDSLDSNDKVFGIFLETFRKCIDVMKEILNRIGFSDRILGIQILRYSNNLDDEKRQIEEIVISSAADKTTRLISLNDLKKWRDMVQDAHEKEYSPALDKVCIRIKNIYLSLLEEFKDLSSEFYKAPGNIKAKDGKTEVYYIKHCFVKKDWKLKKYYAKDEKILETFYGLKVKKKRKIYQKIVSEYSPTLYTGINAFNQLNGYVFFTNKRIIIVRYKLKRDQKEYYFSYPYGKINYFEIKRAFPWTKKRGLFLEFAGGPILSLHFESRWYIGFDKIASYISGKLIR